VAGGPGAADLAELRVFAVEVAEAAGDLVRATARGRLAVEPKGGRGDVVTTADVAAEHLIIGRIRDRWPGHAIRSEEAGDLAGDAPGDVAGDVAGDLAGDVAGDLAGGPSHATATAADRRQPGSAQAARGTGPGRWLWLVDPVDGTNNLAIGLPMYVVGLTLCRDGVPQLGVIHDPVGGQTWSGTLGGGVVGPARPADDGPVRSGGPLLAWTQGYTVASDDPTATTLKYLLERGSRRLLQLWAPLLSWAMLARGDVDAFVGYRAGPLDLHAGALIAAEAGLLVRDLDGGPFDHRLTGGPADGSRGFVAGRPEAVEHVRRLLEALPRTRLAFRTLRTGGN
jgi:myo-inositol-1(or 4)-monophosphatase